MDRRRNLPVADRNGKLICYPASRLMRLREGIGDVDDDGSLDVALDGNGGGGNGGGGHLDDLAAAAGKIFRDESLTAEQKLKKLKLLLRVTDAGEEPDDGDAEPVPPEATGFEEGYRLMRRACRRARHDPRSKYTQAFPGLAMLSGGVAIISEARRPRKTGRLTTARFLEAIQRGR
jgi:hypothetical protein